MRTNVVIVVAVGCVLFPGCARKATSTQQPPAGEEAVVSKTWDAGARVEAVARDGGVIVQRGDAIEVFEPSGESLGRLPIGNPSGTLGHWYALSPGASRVAFTSRDGMIELWDVRSGKRVAKMSAAGPLGRGPSTIPMVGSAPVAPVSWGPPRFLGDGRLVSHHTGGVVIWNTDGTASAAITDEHMSIARDSWELGADTLVVRCGSNAPGVANTSPFLISLKEHRVVGRLRPDRSGLMRFGPIEVWPGEDDDTSVLWFAEADAVHKLPINREPALISASPDGERIVWAEQPWGDHQTKIQVLHRKSGKLVTEEVGKSRLVFLRDDGRQLMTVTEEGAVRHQPIPSFDEGIVARPVPAKEDSREATWQYSLVELGVKSFARAAEMTAAFARPGVASKYQIGALYMRSLTRKDGAKAFAADIENLGIEFKAPEAQLALLDLTEDFARAQLVLGADFLTYWLDAAQPNQKAGQERAIRLGSELSLQLAESDLDDWREALVMKLGEKFPDHPIVAEEMAEIRRLDD